MYGEPTQGPGPVVTLIYLAIIVVSIVALWRVFAKAGLPGWGALVPFYNLYLLLKLAGRPGWMLILFLIPIVNLVIAVIVSLDVASNFGQGTGFGIGLFFLPFIFYPVLGFGAATYQVAATSRAPA
jgi:hypothetical protein